MCLPAATIGSLSTGLQVAGVVSGAYGSYQKSKADKAAYEHQAAVARNNEQYAEMQARDAIARGQSAEAAHRLKVAQLKGSQRASLAARGVALDEGSPLAILQDTDYFGDLDALTIRDNANKEAWGARVQGTNYRDNAAMLTARADAESPFGSAFGTLLTGAGTVSDSWYRRKTTTTPKV